MVREMKIEHEGVEYRAELAIVKDTLLGYEDHGVLAINIDFRGVDGSWGQGTGAYFASTAPQMFFRVKALIDFFGPYSSWEKLKGRECWVLRRDYGGQILGLARKEDDTVLIFESISKEIQDYADDAGETVVES